MLRASQQQSAPELGSPSGHARKAGIRSPVLFWVPDVLSAERMIGEVQMPMTSAVLTKEQPREKQFNWKVSNQEASA